LNQAGKAAGGKQNLALGGLGALVSRARVVVSAHPGIGVLAAATRTPAVLVARGGALQDALRDIARALACAA